MCVILPSKPPQQAPNVQNVPRTVHDVYRANTELYLGEQINLLMMISPMYMHYNGDRVTALDTISVDKK